MFTSFYLSLLALVYFKISLDTIKARLKHKVSLGPGSDNEIGGLVSAHSNFQAYIPLIGLLMYLYETSQLGYPLLIHAIGLTVLSGRLLHYLGIRDAQAPNFKLRKAGMHMTLWPLLLLAFLNLINFVYVTRIQG
ncbi:MAG: MAPEG family protein [Bacteriovoracaceae bacterium]